VQKGVAAFAGLHVAPPGDEVTIQEVTGRPPSKVAGVHDTVTTSAPSRTCACVGAFGTVKGISADDGALANDEPVKFEAITDTV
jgi:hypothetical protein